MPELAEYELAETVAGHRPGTPDNAPMLGRLAGRRDRGAAGHHRNGILLAPVTADLIADLVVTGGRRSRCSTTFAPGRFAMRLTVNGRHGVGRAAAVVAALVAGSPRPRRGVAVAVNGEVVPRSTWAGARLRDGDRVEVLTAAQGG